MNLKHSGGGTILDDETILSAAHCFDAKGAQIEFQLQTTVNPGLNVALTCTTLVLNNQVGKKMWVGGLECAIFVHIYSIENVHGGRWVLSQKRAILCPRGY